MPFALSALSYIQKHTQYPWIIVERWIQEDLKYLYWIEDWLPEFDFETSVTYHLTIESKQTSSLSDEETNPVLGKLMGSHEETELPKGISVINLL